MVEIGKYNSLKVIKDVEHGLYLDGEELGEVLIPRKYVDENTKIDDYIEVFVYYDTEDRPIATTEQPYATIGEFACLQVADMSKFGAFLDWGLIKDLFVPFREQKAKMQVGGTYVVFIYLDDESQRIVGSAKIDQFLDNVPPEYEIDQEVDIMVASKSDLGYTCIINGLHKGIIYLNEIFDDLYIGQQTKAYIKKVREDDKIDLYFHKKGLEGSQDLSDIILDRLKQDGGSINVSDKSASELIYQEFGVSKKQFKKAVGHLYKERLIKIDRERISLL